MQPNAPGTQGYNGYAYAANNPATWADPTGHVAMLTLVLRGVAAAGTTPIIADDSWRA